jgi:hypothetical protein
MVGTRNLSFNKSDIPTIVDGINLCNTIEEWYYTCPGKHYNKIVNMRKLKRGSGREKLELL